MDQENPKRPTDPRFLLDAERTLLAWIRTGIALMAFGFVVARFGVFLRELSTVGGHAESIQPDGAAMSLGVGLVSSGALVNVWATIRHLRMVRRFRQGATDVGTGSSVALGIATGIGGAILIAVLSTVTR
jgi:putative membrane protein